MAALFIVLPALSFGPESPATAAVRPTVVPGTDCTPLTLPSATPDNTLDHVFSRQLGPGWVGGDATYSTALPHGGEAFVFSDTLVGRAARGGSAHLSGIAHNSELFGSVSDLKSSYGGSYSTPRPLIPDSRGHGDQWQVAATFVEDGRQLVFVNEFAPQRGPFERFTGRSALAVFSLADGRAPTLGSMVQLPAGRLSQWGNAVVRTALYTYVYGTVSNTSTGRFFGMHVARVPRGDVTLKRSWRFWDGSKWVAGEGQARTIATGNELTGVIGQHDHAGYEAVSIPGGVLSDRTVDLSYACSPVGPWTDPRRIYSIPQLVQFHNEIAYIPTFHQELSTPSHALISYNLNALNGLSPVKADVHLYQPRFLELTNSGPTIVAVASGLSAASQAHNRVPTRRAQA